MSKWHCEIERYIEKHIGYTGNLVYLIIGQVLKNKTCFCGRAKFDEVTTIEQAKEYAKDNLLNLYKKVTLECLNNILLKLAGTTDKVAKLRCLIYGSK